MTTYTQFFQLIRDSTHDKLDSAGARVVSEVLGRYTLRGLRKIMGMFPETRLDRHGRMCELPTVALAESSAGALTNGSYPSLPIPPEFEPALEAYVLYSIYGMDSNDVKDESLFKHWQNVFKAMVVER